jgi:hypothetical protein
MKGQVKNGKGFLKEKMRGYRVDPPESVWNAISARMGGRRRRGMIIAALAAAASIALAITLGINYFGRDIPDEETYGVIGPESRPSEHITKAGTDAAVRDQRKSLEEKAVHAMENLAAEAADLPAEGIPVLAAGTPGPVAETPDLALNRAGGAEEPDGAERGLEGESEPVSTGPDAVDNVPGFPGRAEAVAESGEGGHAVKDESRADEIQAQTAGDLPDETAPDAGEAVQEKKVTDLEEVARREPRWTIGAALSPLYTFRDAESGAMAGVSDYESGMVSYAGGIQVGFRTTRRLALESGVFFNKMGIAIGAPGIQLSGSEFDWDPLEGEVEGSRILAVANTVGNIVSESGDIYVNNYKLNANYDANTVNREFAGEVYADQGIRQHLDYLEVPFNLRYTLVDRSIKVQLVGGLSTNLLVSNYVTMETAGGTSEIGYLTNIRSVNYSGNAGIGVAYYFLDRLSLSLEPRFRYFLNSVNDATLPSTRPYTFGLYTGLNYLF